ncbi:MAG TPA: hypothetical protein VI423_04760 [Paenisporosarcina sp.]|nr:hypothetical protein [Paenisporosarcina sp.]
MIKYLILLLLALIVFPVVILFVKKIDFKTKLMFLIGGFLIALLGLLAQSSLSFYYALLIMIGLIFAGAVILTKKIETQRLAEEEAHIYVPQSIKEAVEKPTEAYVASTTMTTTKPETENKNDDWLKPSKKEDQ